jgi:hypothetical protein
MTCLDDLPAYDVAKVPLSGMDCVGGPCPALRFCRTRESAGLAGETGVLSEHSSSDSVFPLLRCFTATDSFLDIVPCPPMLGLPLRLVPFGGMLAAAIPVVTQQKRYFGGDLVVALLILMSRRVRRKTLVEVGCGAAVVQV